MDDSSKITGRIIACAIEVHRHLGPGLREINYELALAHEMGLNGLKLQRQPVYRVTYKGEPIGTHRLDLLVEELVVVEVKSVDKLIPIFEAQLLAYLRVSRLRLGLLINFNSRMLKDGIKRLVL